MKKLLLLIFISVSFRLFAQTNVYHPFPDSNAVWKILIVTQPGPPPATPYISSYEHKVSGADTLISGKLYAKVYEDTTYVAAYREDTVNKKVYCISPNQWYSQPHPINTEYLLYDFSLAVGDTFSGRAIDDCFDTFSVVISVDSVLIGSQFRRRTIFNNSGVSFIEGIGSSSGLLDRSCFETEVLLCEFHNDSFIYNPNPSYCIVGVGEHLSESHRVEISPNPSTGIFNMNSSEKFQYSVYDVFGREILQTTNQSQAATLDLSSYPKGIYFVRGKANEKTFSKKIILQ